MSSDSFSATSNEPRVQRRFIKSPDSKVRDDTLAKINQEIKQKDIALAEINAQLKKAVTDPKVANERKTLIGELNELRKTQADFKGKRDLINNKIKEIDASLKRKIGEVQATTSKNNFKSAEEIDARIKKIDDNISSGDMKLVEERLAIKEITSLRKLRKDFSGIQTQQKSIDADKEKIAALKKELSGLNSKEVSVKYESIQKQLDELNLDNKSVNDKRTSLYNKRNALQKEKDALYNSIRKTRADFDEQYKHFKQALADERKRVADEEAKLKAEKEKSERSSKTSKILAEATQPAFEEEIDTVHTLLNVFDPSYVKPTKSNKSALEKSTFVTERQGRVIEQSTEDEIIKKDDNLFFAGSGPHKSSKKGKKGSKKFTLEPDVISSLGDLEIPLPLSQDDVPQTVEALKSKLQTFTATQEETTKKNIEGAKEKIAKLEAGWAKQDAKEAEAVAKAEAKKEAESKEAADQE
ncbi:unnamed protein product [Wickerhamomyces anomalus]